jgi:hypothetical protein
MNDNVWKAEDIYNALFGQLDDKQFHARKTAEIYDWLDASDSESYTIEELTAEWAELDNEVKINRLKRTK